MYNFISQYYDTLFPESAYIEWKCFAKPIIQKSKATQIFKTRKEKPIIVDAGCGSGMLASLFATYYDVIGIDISEDMLCEAVNNYSDIPNITWVCQDISKMNIGRKAAAIFATTDTVNHITNQKKLFAFFKRAYETLESGGFLFFDVVMGHFFTQNYSRQECSFEDFDWGSFFWTCDYSEKTGKVVYDITAFEKCNDAEDIYMRTDEQVVERVWPLETIKEGLTRAGFTNFTIYDNLRHPFEAMNKIPWLYNTLEDFDRLYFICEKP